ncbi:MAG TPA: hypothetical protein VKU41_32940 [Polyangiaceae bacterium]|nr:hypothetical protein [Polyangiaceae bacterium]
MATKTPLAIVKEKFGDKAKLVEAVEKFTGEDLWVGRTNAAKGLAHVSNAKLLRLLATFTQVKETFGTRAKLIEAILELEKRQKDAGLKQRLSEWPVPRLFDAYKAAKKRSAPEAKAAPAKAAAPKGQPARKATKAAKPPAA